MIVMQRPLGIQTARKFIKVFDKDYSGTVDFNEYVALNQFIYKMTASFYQADQDRSGFLDSREIFNALSSAGFQLQFPTVQAICQKFDNGAGQVSADGYIHICAHLAAVRSIFEWNDTQRTGKITLNYDQLSHISTHLLDKPEGF